MIAIAVFALLILAALPEFRAWIQNTQIRTAAQGILNGLQFARAEAVRRNVNIELEMARLWRWDARRAPGRSRRAPYSPIASSVRARFTRAGNKSGFRRSASRRAAAGSGKLFRQWNAVPRL